MIKIVRFSYSKITKLNHTGCSGICRVTLPSKWLGRKYLYVFLFDLYFITLLSFWDWNPSWGRFGFIRFAKIIKSK